MSSHAMFEGLESRQLLAVFSVTIRRVNTQGAGGDEVWGFHLTQGQSYFVLVGGTLAPHGRYTLSLDN